MKLKILIIILAGVLWMERSAMAQTDTATTNQPATSESVATNTASDIAVTNVPPAADTNEAVAGSADTNAPATSATDTGESTNAAASMVPASSSIPLIQFQDVPITTAIDNLARQAGINYLLDPKIGYGQPDQNGQIKPEPSLSIRWENITAEHALTALLDNYGLQLVEDRRSGIARITTKDPTAPPPLITRVVQLKYAGVSNMVDSVQATLTDKRSRVLADTRTSQMVVVATEPEQEAVDTLVNELDKPTRQVLIETKLVEISSNPSTQKGIDWTGTLAAQHVTVGNNVLGGASGQPYSTTLSQSPLQAFNPIGGTNQIIGLINTITYGANNTVAQPGILADTAHGFDPATAFLNADGVSAVLSFLNSSSDAQVVSTPRVVTLDNEMATIEVTRAFPVINVTAGTQNTAGGSSISYSNIGTVLQVTPRISANDYIWLKVTPDVSTFFGTVSKTIDGALFQADEFDTRHIDTQVLIPNANTLVMGGLVKDSPNASYTKVPLLGDIPGLGWAFRSENKSLDKDNLLIFITPTIVKDTDFKPTATDFLKTQPNQMKSPMNPHNWWDSAQPRGDWSNPVPTAGEFNR
jgi:type II secretory pathway component GspD/PulD (secretin)